MRIFLLPEGFESSKVLKVTGQDYHYLSHVLRVQKGDELKGTDGKGNTCRLKVIEVSEDLLTLKAGDSVIRAEENCRISLMQCLPKGKKMDLIIRQATEAGVQHIIPLMSANTVLRIKTPIEGIKKVIRWNRIAREALQQSGVCRLPDIERPALLADAVQKMTDVDLKIFFHEKKITAHSLHRLLSGRARSLSLLIGPEGGFTEKEVELLIENNFHPAWIGDKVLRTETAALCAVASVQIILQEREDWKITE